jgi:hypothetical protein
VWHRPLGRLPHVPDPDALAAEYASRGVEFFKPLKDDGDGLRAFEVKDADDYVLFFGRPVSQILPNNVLQAAKS